MQHCLFCFKKIQLVCCCQRVGLRMAASDEIILTSNSLPFCAQVRVPTHEDGTCLFWEFATDHYDIGFGVYFEWTIAPSNTVSVHVSESSDEEEFEEEERVGELCDLLAFGELDRVWHLLCTGGELDGVWHLLYTGGELDGCSICYVLLVTAQDTTVSQKQRSSHTKSIQ